MRRRSRGILFLHERSAGNESTEKMRVFSCVPAVYGSNDWLKVQAERDDDDNETNDGKNSPLSIIRTTFVPDSSPYILSRWFRATWLVVPRFRLFFISLLPAAPSYLQCCLYVRSSVFRYIDATRDPRRLRQKERTCRTDAPDFILDEFFRRICACLLSRITNNIYEKRVPIGQIWQRVQYFRGN